VNFEKTYIGKDFTCKNSSFNTIKFDHCTIKEWSEVEFMNVGIDSLTFDKYVNESEKVLFDFVTVKEKLEIKHVSFDRELFNHFDMSKAKVKIENSAFNDNFFNSVKWGSISEKRYTASRDIFRQLKFHSEKQKNFIDADGFYSLEMKEQKKELSKERKSLKTLPERISHFFTNSLVFYLHEKTSDFSQNWMLPIFWLFVLGMLGVVYLNIKEVSPSMPLFETILYVAIVAMVIDSILFIGFLSYDIKKNTFISKSKYIIYLLIVMPVILVYLYFTNDPLDDIARLINPSKIFQFKSVEEGKNVFEFGLLMYKIAILFLVYQVIISIKKKVRSK